MVTQVFPEKPGILRPLPANGPMGPFPDGHHPTRIRLIAKQLKKLVI